MKIYAPVKSANGIYASVRFVDGVGETDNPKLISWFKSHGYQVENEQVVTSGYVSVIEDNPVETPTSITTVATTEPDFDSMTPFELREWGRANGFAGKIKNTRDKEKLLKIIRG